MLDSGQPDLRWEPLPRPGATGCRFCISPGASTDDIHRVTPKLLDRDVRAVPPRAPGRRHGGESFNGSSPPGGERRALSVVLLATVSLAIVVLALKDVAIESYWILALRSGDGAARQRAGERLGELRSTRAVPHLLEELATLCVIEPGPERGVHHSIFEFALGNSDQVYEKRFWPFAALVRIGSRATPKLIRALDHEDLSIRAWAARALESVAIDSAPAAIAMEMRRANESARVAAIASRYLVKASLLRHLAYGGESERLAAAMNLKYCMISHPSALPGLLRGLLDRNPTVRECSAATLGDMGPVARPAVPALRELLDDEERDVREAAAGALERIETPAG